MKKITKELIVTLLVAVFIFIGVYSERFIVLFAENAKNVATHKESVDGAIKNINGQIDETLSYHSMLMDLESLVLRLTGTRYIKKDSSIVAVSDTGLLAPNIERIPESDLDAIAQNIADLQEVSNENGADFLYVFTPNKNYDLSLPAGLNNYSKENSLRFVKMLNRYNVDFLDLTAEKESEMIPTEEMFFVTDHHWKPEYGFWATQKIWKDLQNRYGYSYNEDYTNISNYTVKKYKNWFLGSYGKKVGSYFSPLGLDDISLIEPRFETDLVVEEPQKNTVRTGSFGKTAIDMNRIKKKDRYGLNPYAAYSSGNSRYQIYKNNLSTEDRKILIIRDSFACVVTPFLSLNCSEMHVVDIRDMDYDMGKKVNISEHIKEFRPDIVMVLYCSVSSLKQSRGMYRFLQ